MKILQKIVFAFEMCSVLLLVLAICVLYVVGAVMFWRFACTHALFLRDACIYLLCMGVLLTVLSEEKNRHKYRYF